MISLFLNRKRQLLTTRSWDFIGLSKYVDREHNESDIMIGVIDSGIWPESKSFNNKGYGPPPKKKEMRLRRFSFHMQEVNML